MILIFNFKWVLYVYWRLSLKKWCVLSAQDKINYNTTGYCHFTCFLTVPACTRFMFQIWDIHILSRENRIEGSHLF